MERPEIEVGLGRSGEGVGGDWYLDALGTPMTTEQLTRLLDGLREGEGGVKHGLSEKINFEVALLKAVDASRARAIDSLIKEIATMADSLPADGSKKNG